MGGERLLTSGEVALARTMFGDAIDYGAVMIRRRKWFPFQSRKVAMAPCGHIHFHPHGDLYCADFSDAGASLQGLFIHEMTHVWQAQINGRWFVPLRRLVSSRYDYSLKPGWRLERYGVEQQAEIVRHAFMLRGGMAVRGVSDRTAYDYLVNFSGAG
ncbi:MAG: vgr related protein [Novosphingobium sp.]|nr:vgr related protein [Novosphingobium sp.]